jgi:aspartyl protease family protein
MVRTYLSLVVFFGLIGALISTCSSRADFRTETTEGPVEQLVSTRTAPEDSDTDDEITSDSDGIEIPRSPDGHFYANVEINGEPIHMLVDTGATAIALSQDDARSAGIANDGNMNQVVGRGADGDVKGQIVRLDEVELGDTSAQGLYAVVLSRGDQSLLGQNFLSKFSSVDIEGNTMVLR